MKKTTETLKNYKNSIKDSLYIRWIDSQKSNLLLSICISTFLTILSYPGIIYSDSYGRISFADSLKMSIHAFMSGNAELSSLSSWLTVTPSFFILLSKEIVGSIVLYTFVQCLLFWFFTIVFVDQLNGHKYPIWNKICVLISPVMWAFGVYYEASVGCVTAIFIMLLIIWKWRVLQTRFDKIISLLLMIFSSFICFGYRANAFSILPIIFIIVFLREKKIFARTVIICSIIIGFVCSSSIPKALNINTMSSYAAGFVWEIISIIQSMDSEKQEEYIGYLDDIFGDGATATAVQNNSYNEQGSNINPMFNSPINSGAISSPGNSLKIIKRYVRLALNEPVYFLKMRWEFISHSLGINKPINMFEYNYNRWDRMNEFGFNDSHPREVYVNYFLAFMEFMVVLRRPWIMYLICLILILIWRFKFIGKRSEINLYEASYGVSVFYYGAYLLNTQSFEFRYYFPSWILLFAIFIGLVPQMVFNKIKTRNALLALFILFTTVAFVGGYHEYTKLGDETVANVTSNGVLLYDEEGYRVYFFDNNLYFISKNNVDNEFTYFLHFYPSSGDMINCDFKYDSYSLPTSFYKESVAVRDIPKQQLLSLEFGQYYGDKRFWEKSINILDFLSCPKEIIVSSLTDESWDNGYSRTDNVFLVENLGIENYLLIGKYLNSQNGNRYMVTNVEEVAGYLRIYTDSQIVDKTIQLYEVTDE